jgi:hypothetical protein
LSWYDLLRRHWRRWIGYVVIAFDHVAVRVILNGQFVNATGCVRCELLLRTKVT